MEAHSRAMTEEVIDHDVPTTTILVAETLQLPNTPYIP